MMGSGSSHCRSSALLMTIRNTFPIPIEADLRVEQLPGSLRRALRAFILTCAARAAPRR